MVVVREQYALQHEELDIPRFGPRAAPTTSYRVRRPEAAGTKRMLITAGAIGGATLVALVGGWAMFGHGQTPIPIIQAESKPFRVKPEVRGGLQITGANDDILSGDATKQADALAAPAEVPQTEQLHQLQQAEVERSHAASASLMAAAPAPEEPVISGAPVLQTPPARKTAAPPSPGPSAASAQSAPAAITAEEPRVNLAPLARPSMRPVGHLPASGGTQMASGPAAAPAQSANVAASHPIDLKPAAEPKPAADTTHAESGHAGAGHSAVQLAAVGSEDDARRFWQRMTARMPELLGGKRPDMVHVERDGRSFWRVRLQGFADATAADAFCEQVRGKGGGCSVAAF
jgi:hypothetical protein